MAEPRTAIRSPRQRRMDHLVAAALVCVFAGMVALTFASAELYDLFCKATGYNGATRVATAAPKETSSRRIKVRFDSNVAPGLPWRFEPETTEIEVRLGQTVEVGYTIRNLASYDTTGLATYNVQPEIAGAYFNKIQCFCFTEQALKAGEARQEPVVFFVDPAFEKDADARGISTITLSYTFNPPPAGRRAQPVAAVGSGQKLQ